MSKKLIAIVAGAIIATQVLSMGITADAGTQTANAAEKETMQQPRAGKPILNVVGTEIKLKTGQKFDFMEGVTATTADGKDITSKVTHYSSFFDINEPGVYGVEYNVEDGGQKAYGLRTYVVEGESLTPPEVDGPTVALSKSEIYLPVGYNFKTEELGHLVTTAGPNGEEIPYTFKESTVNTAKEGTYKIEVHVEAGGEAMKADLAVKVVAKDSYKLNPSISLAEKVVKMDGQRPLAAGNLILESSDHLGRKLDMNKVKFKLGNDYITMSPAKSGSYGVNVEAYDYAGRVAKQAMTLNVNGSKTAPTLTLKQKEVTITSSKNINLLQYVASCTDVEDGDLLAKGKVRFFKDGKETTIIFLNEGMNDVVFSVTDSDGMNTKATLKVNYQPTDGNGGTSPEIPSVKPDPEVPPTKPEVPPTKPEEGKPGTKPEEGKPSTKPEGTKPEAGKPGSEKPSDDKKPSVKPNKDKPKTGDISVVGALAIGVASLGTALKLRKKK